MGDLSFHLQSDDKKEDRHQSIVDPVLERMFKPKIGNGQPDGRFPEGEVRFREGRIRQSQRKEGARQQDDTAGRFYVQESIERLDQPVNRFLREQFLW